MLHAFLTHACDNRLSDLLAKDSNAEDPARIINISSVASVSAHAEGSAVADQGMGLWSCKSDSISSVEVI